MTIITKLLSANIAEIKLSQDQKKLLIFESEGFHGIELPPEDVLKLIQELKDIHKEMK